DPGHAGVRFNLALALYKSALVPDAARELEQVLSIDPAHRAAILLLADCRLQMWNEAGVVALLEPHAADLRQERLYAYRLRTALLRRNELERGQVLIDRLFR